ncbi:MAG TPA: TetR family transcriptional regulator [Streptosporangiaceae bacterium]|nr:TetR family transcriptional regulator [Streptosporangiaceae bacterium]
MRSGRDLTAAAKIREAAMRLFAGRGVAGVTVRDIAAEAGVSPSLVIHHYRTKEGLKAAVDERVSAAVADLLTEVLDPPEGALTSASMAAVIADRFAGEPALPAYLRRLLVDGGEPATALFRRLYDALSGAMAIFGRAGIVRPAADETARLVFLLANDLAMLILREQIAGILGVDPLTPGGMTRWSDAVMEVYTRGLLVAPGKEES